MEIFGRRAKSMRDQVRLGGTKNDLEKTLVKDRQMEGEKCQVVPELKSMM